MKGAGKNHIFFILIKINCETFFMEYECVM